MTNKQSTSQAVRLGRHIVNGNPSQHPLVGERVNVFFKGNQIASGLVVRVVATRFGPLACLDNSGRTSYAVRNCKVI